MKNVRQGLGVTALALMVGIGCTQKVKDEGPKKVVITAKAQMEAEELAEAGEQLISPTTFHLAEKVFQMVLTKDPRNQKARLYTSALKQFIVFKGVLARVRPYALKYGDEAQYQKMITDLRESPIKTWLLDGKEDIETIEQMQDLAIKYREAANEFRLFLKANPNLDLTIYLNEFVFKQVIENARARDCRVLEDSVDQVSVECDTRNSARRKMNAADVVLLRQMVGGQVLYATLLTSYSTANLEKVVKTIKDIDRQQESKALANAEKQAVLEKVEGLGKLRKDHSLGLLTELGADFKGAMEWVLKYQNELCPKGHNSPENRKGYIFEEGACVGTPEEKDGVQKVIGYIQQSLENGVAEVEIKDPNTQENSKTKLAIFKWAHAPVADLRQILPVGYDECGATAFRDDTFGGIFVNRDANRYLVSKCEPIPAPMETP
ncbi:MAG: hypothetical protein HC902_00510 [Calothrix sp. SM1_5_4]|nr:hypothetical protein [Calothrix sp. SM1_5_4]